MTAFLIDEVSSCVGEGLNHDIADLSQQDLSSPPNLPQIYNLLVSYSKSYSNFEILKLSDILCKYRF
jgi:hypothetical protein